MRRKTMSQQPTIVTGWEVWQDGLVVHSGHFLGEALAARRHCEGVLVRRDVDVSPWGSHYGDAC